MTDPDGHGANETHGPHDADAPPPAPGRATPAPDTLPEDKSFFADRHFPVESFRSRAPTRTRRLDRQTRALLALVGSVGLLLLGVCFGLAVLDWIFTTLFFAAWMCLGWIRFVWQEVPQVDFSPSQVAVAIPTAVLLLAGIHWAGRWFVAGRSERAGNGPGRSEWTAKRTLSIGVALLSAGAVSVASVGISRHVAWLATSDRVWSSYIHVHRQVQSKSQLKQIGLAIHNHHDVARSFPPGTTFDAATGRALHGWIAPLLPFLAPNPLRSQVDWSRGWDEGGHVAPKPLHERMDWSRAWDEGDNAAVCRTPLEVLLHPAVWYGDKDMFDERGFAVTSYAGNVWVLGGDRRFTFRDATDGTSTTLLIGEAASQPRAWGHPRNARDPSLGLDTSPHGFGMPNQDFVHFTLVDGAVIRLSKKTDPRVLRALATPHGGDDATLPE